MHRALRVPLPAVLLALLGCATGYQSSGLTGGFSDTQLAKHRWEVEFRGNAYTKEKRAADMALLRGTELVLGAGCTHYEIDESRHERRTESVVVTQSDYGVTATPMKKGSARLVISCADPDVGLDARRKRAQILDEYGIRE